MIKRLFSIFIVILIAVMPVLATTITYNTSTPIALTPTNWTGSLAFQKFNPTLGILDSVTINLSGYMETTITVSSTANATGYAKTSVELSVQDAGGNLNVPEITLISPAFNFTNLNGTVVSGLLTKSGSSSDTYTSSAVLAEFKGIGDILLNAGTFVETLLAFTSGNANASQVTGASLTGSVTYNYTVPEPATIAILCGGAFALFKRKSGK